MSTDIISFAEVLKDSKWHKVGEIFPEPWFEPKRYNDHPFGWQDYALFGFLAGVRNMSQSEVVRHDPGLPENVTKEVKDLYEPWDACGKPYDPNGMYAYGTSTCSLSMLLDFDYEKTFKDQRSYYDHETGHMVEGKILTYRKHLGKDFFIHLDILKGLSSSPMQVRVIYWFVD